MECDPTRICELLVGLGDVEIVGVDDGADRPLRAASGVSAVLWGLWRAGVVQRRTQR